MGASGQRQLGPYEKNRQRAVGERFSGVLPLRLRTGAWLLDESPPWVRVAVIVVTGVSLLFMLAGLYGARNGPRDAFGVVASLVVAAAAPPCCRGDAICPAIARQRITSIGCCRASISRCCSPPVARPDLPAAARRCATRDRAGACGSARWECARPDPGSGRICARVSGAAAMAARGGIKRRGRCKWPMKSGSASNGSPTNGLAATPAGQ